MKKQLLSLSFLLIAPAPLVHATEAPFDKHFLRQHLSDYAGHGFEWENNRIGITDKAPAPWKPVAVQTRSVRLTHRTLVMGEKLLVESITSLEQPLLSRGIIWTLKDASDVEHSLVCDPQPLSANDSAVVFQGHRDISGGRALLECRVEFDGFIHLSLDLEPATPASALTVKELRLVTHLRRSAASHYKFFVPYNFTTEEMGGNRDAATGPLLKPLRLPFSPMLWLGTPQLGLEWMCETDHAWGLRDPLDAVQVLPQADEVVWTTQMVNQPVSFTQPRHIALAFYIMPTRPAPFPGWNADSVLVNSDPILDFKAALAPWHTYYGVHRNTSPTPGQPKAAGRTLTARLRHFGMNTPFTDGQEARRYQRQRRELREAGIRYLPYTTLHGLPTDLPSAEVQVDKAWLDHWDLRTAKEGHKHYFYAVLQHKSLIDFQLHHALRTIREHKLDGQYFDLSQPRAAAGYARRHASDFRNEAFYMPLFGYREFFKRFYIATQELNPEFLIIQHAVIPSATSSTYAIGSGGEHLKRWFSEDGKKHTHKIAADGTTQLDMDFASYAPDYFKIPPMMYPVGNWFPVFGQNLSFSDILKGTAGYYRKHPDQLIYYCRTFLARSLVHGVPVWIRSLDMPAMIRVCQALDLYGPRTGTTAVHAAVDDKKHLIAPSDAAALEYRIEMKPGHLLLIASNSSLETKPARFDLSALIENPSAWGFQNAESRQPIPHSNGRLEFPITKHDFRIVIGVKTRSKP